MTTSMLRVAFPALACLGAPVILLLGACSGSNADQRLDEATTCSVSYGTAMADLARRFELLGRAAAAARFDLANYELGEIGELFENTLPHATPPAEGHPEILPAEVQAFVTTNVPDLKRALASRDASAAASAYARTATACNGCHEASGHGFISVPSIWNRSIPDTTPASP